MNKHNEGYRKGEHTWSMGVNQFSDGTRPQMSNCQKNDIPPPQVEFVPEPNPECVEPYVANDEEWEKYKVQFDKVYNTEEEPLK